jgi:hypothetical protein
MDSNEKAKRALYFQGIDKQLEVKHSELDHSFLTKAEKGAVRLVIKYMELLQSMGKEVSNG